jgi:hypothetical protein
VISNHWHLSEGNARLFPEAIHHNLGDLLKRIIWPGRPLFSWCLMALCLAPQLLVGLLGGWLSARYRIVRSEADHTELS